MSVTWNLWHGCHKKSPGCANCYVYRGDTRRDRDASLVYKTKDFNKIVERKKNGEYKVKSGELVYTCFTSDFLLEDADEWREEAWRMMKERNDLHFLFITKRPERLNVCVPEDWGKGYENVTICCTCENQQMVEERLPIYTMSPIKEKIIICEPLLGKVDLRNYLPFVSGVVVGGESGSKARVCDYDWVLDIRNQCIEANVLFTFKQTGYRFKKDGKIYLIKRQFQHQQASKANINVGKYLIRSQK